MPCEWNLAPCAGQLYRHGSRRAEDEVVRDYSQQRGERQALDAAGRRPDVARTNCSPLRPATFARKLGNMMWLAG